MKIKKKGIQFVKKENHFIKQNLKKWMKKKILWI